MADLPTAKMTAEQLFDLCERFMAGENIGPDERKHSRMLFLAGSYGAQAFEKASSQGIPCDHAPYALLRSFLLALIDPLHPDLDYLRADPASGALERAKREDAAHG